MFLTVPLVFYSVMPKYDSLLFVLNKFVYCLGSYLAGAHC